MSVELYVYLNEAKLPAVSELQAALHAAGADCQLPSDVNLFTHTGYVPAQHQGHESGFEWYFGSVDETFGGDDPLAANQGYSHVATLVTHSDLREALCSMSVALDVARLSGGVIFDPSSGEVVDEGDFRGELLQLAAELAKPRRRNRP